MPMQYRLLTLVELKAIANIIRQWQEFPYKNEAKKLLVHIKAQEQEIASLRRRVQVQEQPGLPLEKPIMNRPPTYTRSTEEPEKWPLPKRLNAMEQGSREWLLTLKLNHLTEEQAQEMIKAYKAEHGL